MMMTSALINASGVAKGIARIARRNARFFGPSLVRSAQEPYGSADRFQLFLELIRDEVIVAAHTVKYDRDVHGKASCYSKINRSAHKPG